VDRSVKAAVPDTFPASDPAASTPAVGVRAEGVADLMDSSASPEVLDPATVAARFADHVTAKLAIEKLVRDVPVDRRSTELSDEGERVMLEVTISKLDLDRVTEILRRAGGELSP
jgi:hypothetical protein